MTIRTQSTTTTTTVSSSSSTKNTRGRRQFQTTSSRHRFPISQEQQQQQQNRDLKLRETDNNEKQRQHQPINEDDLRPPVISPVDQTTTITTDRFVVVRPQYVYQRDNTDGLLDGDGDSDNNNNDGGDTPGDDHVVAPDFIYRPGEDGASDPEFDQPTPFPTQVYLPPPPPTPSPTQVFLPPTPSPTERRRPEPPTQGPTDDPRRSQQVTPETAIFYVIADVPYSSSQSRRLLDYMTSIPPDADFVVHLGDIQTSSDNCRLEAYQEVSNILRESSAPVFIVLGDNDWNDCGNQNQALSYWMDTFLYFETRYWSHGFNIQRQPGYRENVYFVFKGTLFITLNLVGGEPPSYSAWQAMLNDYVRWVTGLISGYKRDMDSRRLASQVVLFAHADPTESDGLHDAFFVPLASFLRNDMNDQVPVLYMNGDWHEWDLSTNFYGARSLMRIMLVGEAAEAPTRMSVTGNLNSVSRDIRDVFQYRRR